MKRYARQTIVVKYGGHAMGDAETAQNFARDIALLKQVGVNPIVVHGGGPQIGQMLERLKIKSEFIDGLRVTDAATVEIVEMVLSGTINKQIVAGINAAGGRAVGISGKDGGLVRARKVTRSKRDPDSNIEKVLDLGFVGEPDRIDPTILTSLAQADLIPVIAPIGLGPNGETYNINADTVAGAVAAAVRATRLLLLTDVVGVLDKAGAAAASLGGRSARVDRRRYHPGRHDPQGRDLPDRGRSRRRRLGHSRWPRAARGPGRALHRGRHRHDDRRLIRR